MSNINKPEIVVLDAIMGNGKTDRIKQIMSEESRPIIYITPLLNEASTVVGAIVDDKGKHQKDDSGYYMYDNGNVLSSKSFMLPNNRNNHGSKLENIKSLVDGANNIASTHQLFSMIDLDTIENIKKHNYMLVVDESLNVWTNLNIYESFNSDSRTHKRDLEDEKDDLGVGSQTDKDIQTLIKNGFIEVDSVGLLHWQDEKFPDADKTFYSKVKRLCDLKQLYLSNGRVVFWELNHTILSAFSKVIVGTYMFEHSFMSHYLDVHSLDYSVKKFGNKPSFYKDLINIEQGRLNNVGEKDFSLSYSDLCVKRHGNNHPKEVLRKNLDNFMKNKCKSYSGDRIWTCFKKVTPNISQRRYTTDWIAYNTKATNDYRFVGNVAYLCNNFPNTFLVSMVTKRNSRDFDGDMWALQEMLQFIFRSRLRGNENVKTLEGRKINLYIPSKRMRNLLEDWLEDKFEGVE